MRNAFADEINRLAALDERIVLLSGDIGNRLFDPFKTAHPERFFNCGVAETNMVGMAAGMALAGLRPVVYSIAAFVSLKVLEQVRVDLCYHRAPVVIVGVGAGLSYASLGPTHHALEDVAALRALPGMTVLAPGDAFEVRALLPAAIERAAPVYMRLGKKDEPLVHGAVPVLGIGESIDVRAGRDVCLLASGTVLPIACEAATILAHRGVSARVTSMPTIKPLDETLLAAIFRSVPLVATVEEHARIGGLGGAVAEWLADTGPPRRSRLMRFGTPDAFMDEAGTQAHARRRLGLTAEHIAAAVARAHVGADAAAE